MALSIVPESGQISGTPTAIGTFTFTAMVTDAAHESATVDLSITVNDNLAVSNVSLANGSMGIFYTQTLTASGAVGTMAWSISAGTLPAGLALVPATGVISGTPTATGTSSFTATVTDGLLRTASKALSININSGIAVATTSLPDGVIGTAYLQTRAAVGGTGTYSWGLLAGDSLPAGLSLVGSTGVISGTPTTAGTATFSVMATDSVGHTATQALSITVNAPVTPSVTQTEGPALGELTARVQAACAPAAIVALDASEQTVETALCTFFDNSSQLSPSIRNSVGHLILKIAGVMGKGEDKDDPSGHVSSGFPAGNPNDHGKGDDRSNPGATVTPTPTTTTGARVTGSDGTFPTPTITPTHTVRPVINHFKTPATSPRGNGNHGRGSGQ